MLCKIWFWSNLVSTNSSLTNPIKTASPSLMPSLASTFKIQEEWSLTIQENPQRWIGQFFRAFPFTVCYARVHERQLVRMRANTFKWRTSGRVLHLGMATGQPEASIDDHPCTQHISIKGGIFWQKKVNRKYSLYYAMQCCNQKLVFIWSMKLIDLYTCWY